MPRVRGNGPAAKSGQRTREMTFQPYNLHPPRTRVKMKERSPVPERAGLLPVSVQAVRRGMEDGAVGEVR